jgi:hypothetical protein
MPIDWSISRESYMRLQKSFSVEAKRSHLGVQMCSVIHVCDSSHKSHTHACYKIIFCHQKFTGFWYLWTHLSSDEVIQKVDRGRVKEQVVRYGVVEKAGISVP